MSSQPLESALLAEPSARRATDAPDTAAALETDRSVAGQVEAAHRCGRRDYVLRRLLASADLAGLAIGYVVVAVFLERAQPGKYLLWAIPTFVVWLVLFKLYGLYDRDAKRVSYTTVDDLPWLFHALLLGSLLLWGYFRLVPLQKLQFDAILLFGAVALGSIAVLRSAVRHGAARLVAPERLVIVGDSPAGVALVSKIRAHPEYGLDPVGLIAPPGADVAGSETFLPLIGELGRFELERLVSERGIGRIVIARGEVDEELLLDVVRACKTLGVNVSVLPPLFDAMGSAVEVDDVEGVTVLGINPPVLGRSSRLVKRGLDLAGAASGLLLTSPLLVAIALCVKLTSAGPVLFRQRRVGRDGQSFTLLKFRTMVAGAEQRRAELLADSSDPGWLKLDHDPRITRVGRLLRFSSLDELPQLWNVLRGQMSLVGPRPLIESEHDQIEGWGLTRLDLMPGITGLWQVLGRTNIPFEEMVKLDYLYVTNWSLWTDVRLILRTLPVVVARRGVN